MIEDFLAQDPELDFINATPKDIIQSITLDDVAHFLETLGVTQIQINREKNYLICPTICHNPIDEAESMKLYWYQNNKIFRCYTECNEAMSIFTLYQKYMAINYYPVTFEDAEEYVKKCLRHLINFYSSQTKPIKDFDIEKYKYTSTIPQLEEYPSTVLDCFTKYYHPSWLKDGITKDAMNKFDIRFSISNNSIIIPQKDINGRLIGIRERVLEEKDIQKYGKYHPIKIGETTYSHMNGFSLYGIYEHKDSIKRRRSAILVEGEKSVLLDDGFYPNFGNAVAVLGNGLNKYQVSLLTNYLDVNEIVIAYDKEYENWDDDDAKAWRKKILDKCNTYKQWASFSYIWDYDHILKRKDSPYDKGKEAFEYLYKNRVKVN